MRRIPTMALGPAVAAMLIVAGPAAQAAKVSSARGDVFATAVAGTAVAGSSVAGSPAAGTGGAGTEASMDWSGWDVTDGTYRSVSASWTVPSVTCAAGETSYSADWVGLDGDGSDSVEQIGTSSDCDSGSPAYSSWYEFYPSVSVSLPNRVKAGDKVTSEVTAVPGSDRFTLKLTDISAGWSVTRSGDSPQGSGASAEIIAEAPSGSGRSGSVLPLADFKKVTFSGVSVNGKNLSSFADAHKIAMVDDSGAAMATVSAVSSGDTFGVTWISDGSGVGGSGFPDGSVGGGAAGSGSVGGGAAGSGSVPDGSAPDGAGSTSDGSGSTGSYGYGYGYGNGNGNGWGDAGGWPYGYGYGNSGGYADGNSGGYGYDDSGSWYWQS